MRVQVEMFVTFGFTEILVALFQKRYSRLNGNKTWLASHVWDVFPSVELL